MTDTVTKGVRACLVTLGVVGLVLVAFVAGFVSGKELSAAVPVAEQAYEFEDAPLPATATPAQAESDLQSELTPTPAGGQDSMDLYWEVWGLVEQDYYGELPSEEERLFGAIRGALQTLDDDYTSFIEPDVAEINRSDMSGSFEGIGAVVRMNDANQVEIVRTLEDQPAEVAGLRAGDVVLAVDGRSLEGLGLYEAIALIRGPANTKVVLTIARADEPDFDVEITRATIPLPTIDSEMLPGNIGYVRLYEFNGQATEQLREALTGLLSQQPVGLILDLRDNPGGFLSQAVSVADEFLPAGIVLYERGNDGEEVFESTDKGLADEIPLVVLINSGSASASEIVAGAIQDRGRGVLIGETSFGKGSVQQAHRLSNGGELRVTIARWYTPNEQPLHGNGLEPDISVPLTEEDQAADADPQLDRAVEYLLNGR